MPSTSARNHAIRQQVAVYALALERQLFRNAGILDRLDRYCGKETRLFDSQHPRGWEGLEGVIGPALSSHSRRLYILRHYDLYDDRWREHYIFQEKVRSIKKKGTRIEIDMEWVSGGNVSRNY